MYDERKTLDRLSLEETLKSYPAKFLVWLYDTILRDLAQDYSAALPQAVWKPIIGRRTPRKPHLIGLLKAVLEDETLARCLITGLPGESLTAYRVLVWESEVNLEMLEAVLGTAVTAENLEEASRLNLLAMKEEFGFLIITPLPGHSYRFFTSTAKQKRGLCSAWLPAAIRKAFKPFFPPPPDYNLLPLVDVTDLPGRLFTCAGTAMADMRLVAEYIAQGHLKYTKTGRPTMPSLRNLHRMITGPEFFEDAQEKDLLYVRTRLLLGGMAFAGVEERELLLSDAGSAAPARAMMKKILRNGSFLHEGLLSHFVNNQSVCFHHCPQKIGALFSFFGQFPRGGWISFKNMERYFSLREQTPSIFTDRGNMLVARVTPGYGGWSHHLDLDETNERELVGRPLLRGYAFVLAAFGLAEIVYEPPETGEQSDYGRSHRTMFDGLQSIRLTALGEYVFGQRRTLDVKEGPPLRSEIVLDDARLLATCREPDAMTELAINQFLERLTPGRYRMTAKTLLGGCSSRKDVEERIRLFRRVVSAKPPPVWEAFFAKTLSRISPLERESELVVFKVGEGEEILRLFASDPTLRELALKVEGRRVAVRRDDLPKLAKRLEQSGYLSPLPGLGAKHPGG